MHFSSLIVQWICHPIFLVIQSKRHVQEVACNAAYDFQLQWIQNVFAIWTFEGFGVNAILPCSWVEIELSSEIESERRHIENVVNVPFVRQQE